VYDLLWGLNNDGHYTVGYDDIAILINGNFLRIVSEVLQTALCSPTVVQNNKSLHQPQ
jgi:hypothetical protein